MRVLSIGECMAELAPSPQAGGFSLGFAGDAFNTAWYLAQISPQLDVRYQTAVGDDRLSDQMLDFMKQSGIGTEHVARRPNETIGLYMIHLDDGERSFSYWRGQSAAHHLVSDVYSLKRSMGSADLIYFSGISLAILSPSARVTFLDAVRAHRASGKTVAFDTNLRPRLWQTPDEMRVCVQQAAAPRRHCIAVLRRRGDVVRRQRPRCNAGTLFYVGSKPCGREKRGGRRPLPRQWRAGKRGRCPHFRCRGFHRGWR